MHPSILQLGVRVIFVQIFLFNIVVSEHSQGNTILFCFKNIFLIASWDKINKDPVLEDHLKRGLKVPGEKGS